MTVIDKVYGRITKGKAEIKNINSEFIITFTLFVIAIGASVLTMPC